MPRNSAGVYTLPPTNPVVPFTTIATSWANPTLSDIAAELTNSLDRTGRGGMLASFKLFDGTLSQPGLGWLNEPNMGIYRPSSGNMSFVVSGATLLQVTDTDIVSPIKMEHRGEDTIKLAGAKNWRMKNIAGELVFTPSATIDAEDWDVTKNVILSPVTGLPYVKLAGDTMTGELAVKFANSDIRINAGIAENETLALNFVHRTGNDLPVKIAIKSTGSGAWGSGDLQFYTSDTFDGTAGLLRMTIASGGNVGIGAAVPQTRLTVHSTTSNDQLELGHSNGFAWRMGRNSGDGRFSLIGVNGAAQENFSMTLAGETQFVTGNVGIKCTPTTSLSVNGELRVGEWAGTTAALTLAPGGVAKLGISIDMAGPYSYFDFQNILSFRDANGAYATRMAIKNNGLVGVQVGLTVDRESRGDQISFGSGSSFTYDGGQVANYGLTFQPSSAATGVGLSAFGPLLFFTGQAKKLEIGVDGIATFSGVVKGMGFSPTLRNFGNVAATFGLDFNTGQTQQFVLTGPCTINSINNLPPGSIIRINVGQTQNGLTFSVPVIWPAGITPTFSSGPQKWAIIVIENIDGSMFGNAAMY